MTETGAKSFSHITFRSAARFALSQLIKVVAPPLSHLYAFIPVIAPIIDPSDRIAVTMRERALDGVGMPEAAFVEHC